MANRFEYDVFLSYSAQDKASVRTLARDLSAAGLRVWFDEWAIEPGAPPSPAIDEGLEYSRTLLLCMSAHAFGSDWVALERSTAFFRDLTDAERRFIPLRLDDAPIPPALQQFAYVDWRKAGTNSQKVQELVAACQPLEAQSWRTPRFGPASTLRGHHNRIRSVAISASGQWIASASWDKTVRLWKAEEPNHPSTLKGHTGPVRGVAITSDGARLVSGSNDGTVRFWDATTRRCLTIFEGHHGEVNGVAISPDGELAASGSNDASLRIWHLKTGQCLSVLEGHLHSVRGVTFSPDGRQVLSSSNDGTIRIWDLEKHACLGVLEGHIGMVCAIATSGRGCSISGGSDGVLRVWDMESRQRGDFEGHSGPIWGVALSSDGQRAVSCSGDGTVRAWDVESGRCLGIFEGHSGTVFGVAITPDGRRAVSGAKDRSVRVWDLSALDDGRQLASNDARYTNAKVVLVGDSGVGKTGLALRLCEDRWEPTESTHGMRIDLLDLKQEGKAAGIDREVWLWDFAGQPDYRLVHQLYMDETALAIFVFDPQNDNPFEELGYWEKAIRAAARTRGIEPEKLLVAARCDRGGITVSRKRFDEYCKQHGIAGLWLTGAKSGDGCADLKAAIAKHLPWDRLPWVSTTPLFKKLKDALLKLKDSDVPLIRLSELRQRLQLLMPGEQVEESDLRAVVGLMQGQGVVRQLDFGDFVLLQPERLNGYASVVVRMAREHVDEMGSIPEQQVLERRLEYGDMARLRSADEEILLRSMVQTLLDRALCLREQTAGGTLLVFPSYFRRDKPEIPAHPNVFVTYGFSGALEAIYSTESPTHAGSAHPTPLVARVIAGAMP
jgi:WD40 repeat protein